MKLFSNIFWAVVMSPFSFFYGCAIALRNLFYDWGWFKSHRLSVPVISVGNLTVGGVGKTPLVLWLAKSLIEKGLRVGIVSRGYGRNSRGLIVVSDGHQVFVDPQTGGDEPVMMAQICKEAVVAVCEDRLLAAVKVITDYDVDVIVLDDAYQNRRLFRNLNIAVIHSRNGFGNGSILPGGPLRESKSGLKRADLIVLSHFNEQGIQSKLIQAVHALNLPVIKATHRPVGWLDLAGQFYELDTLKKKKAVAFSGIANSKGFFDSLADFELETVITKSFKDHHVFTKKDLEEIESLAFKNGADVIVMTQKDAIKLKGMRLLKHPYYALAIELNIIPDSSRFESMIDSALKTEGGACDK